MDQHELLIRHAVSWADKHRQPLNPDLLGTVLQLRDFHDASAPQEWPAGSAEHLMLVRWPSHGPSGVPDVEQLVETLDSFWRFLRGTGRMASASADPRELAKEARRAAPHMPDACTDPARHGAAKSLVEFGESIGLSLDGAESIEELNERMQQVMEAWNALPDDQRMTMAPSSAHQGSLRGMAATEYLSSLTDDGDDDLGDVFGLGDEDGTIPFADLADVAADVRAAPFVQQCRRLVEWVGERGQQITPKEVLRLAPAREAYDVLELGEWDLEADRLVYGDLRELPLEAQEVMATTARDSFRSSADCQPLDRLWSACVQAGLLELSRTKAYAAWKEPTSDEEWRHLGVLLATAVLTNAYYIHVQPLIGVLLHLLDPSLNSRDPLPLGFVEDWWWQSPKNYVSQLGDRGEQARRWSDSTLHRALHEMDDLRVWRRQGDALLPTALGRDVALMAAALVEQGVIDS